MFFNLDVCKNIKKLKIMKKNMGIFDRSVRAVIAIIIAVLYYTGVISGTLGLVLLIIACVFLLTSYLSFCPLYVPLGLNTICKKKSEE